jgi:hypothetical protein
MVGFGISGVELSGSTNRFMIAIYKTYPVLTKYLNILMF